MKKFWYESNAVWGNVVTLDDLKEKLDYQLAEPNGINNVDMFLDMSKEHVNEYGLNFGTRREHDGERTLRMFLIEEGVLDDFLKLTQKDL